MKISDERLAEISATYGVYSDVDRAMARELQAARKVVEDMRRIKSMFDPPKDEKLVPEFVLLGVRSLARFKNIATDSINTYDAATKEDSK